MRSAQDVRNYTMTLSALEKSKQWQWALELLFEMSRKKLKPDLQLVSEKRVASVGVERLHHLDKYFTLSSGHFFRERSFFVRGCILAAFRLQVTAPISESKAWLTSQFCNHKGCGPWMNLHHCDPPLGHQWIQ